MEDLKTNKTLVNVILDRSGSMRATAKNTISGYNEYLNGLRADKATEYSVTLIQFDTPTDGPELTIKYEDKPLAEVRDLSAADYEPRGLTPLYDAIGECIRRVQTKDRAVLTVIITDGQENSSREFTRETIKSLIKTKQDDEHWTFAFLGANIDSYEVGGSLGVAAGSTTNYAPGMEKHMYAALACSTVARSEVSARLGVRAAASMSMFDDSQRQNMGDDLSQQTTGGRPTKAPPFRPPQPPVQDRPRTGWRATRG